MVMNTSSTNSQPKEVYHSDTYFLKSLLQVYKDTDSSSTRRADCKRNQLFTSPNPFLNTQELRTTKHFHPGELQEKTLQSNRPKSCLHREPASESAGDQISSNGRNLANSRQPPPHCLSESNLRIAPGVPRAISSAASLLLLRMQLMTTVGQP
ncbi:hypothetical protein JTE90_022778 [Oedothorax gibbosus]|uniref:Uncharacterized protein n=1 Tax=Oedothorax gibbosus TaxID=931172 RepID=A0AAV6U783_9ARAC|nr:hypothetical protein JTE90_022778 [Oedothorax gibbosus]